MAEILISLREVFAETEDAYPIHARLLPLKATRTE
jgi:hypothetical protein